MSVDIHYNGVAIGKSEGRSKSVAPGGPKL